ncbi:MAG: hypothetical protein CVU65_10980 [Deltaproteobacteria bacterium HGW-Deltaproteobacteria-22]|nr:MAG: hypothetical protein CVU65_10980 [Deltaproteobacteria bacterium HGW-Deltaproteobacteria-22]
MKNRTIILTLLATCLMLWSCDTKTKTVDSCGDGFVDPGEQCDGNVGENTCASLGHYNQIGTLVCTPLCKFDTEDCGGRCGDNTVNADNEEQCDTTNLNGQTCQSLGHTGGELTCASDCTFVVSACAGRCGNGVIDVDEVCDGGELSEETCLTQGYHGGELVCAADCGSLNLDNCTAVGRCGDGLIQGAFGEVCDGTSLDGATCVGEGYYGGILACSQECQLDLAECEAVGRCGDGVIQEAFPEWCDGENLDGQTCVSLGYSQGSGALACTAGCAFDETACVPRSENADLSTLTVSSGTLVPVFFANRTSYSVIVTSEVTSLTVVATVASPYATVSITPTQPMVLSEGDNLATVTVTAESGATKEYRVAVTRLAPNEYGSLNIGTLKHVPAGTFQRDSTATNLSTVSTFRMSRHEITRAQWTAVTGWADPSDAMFSGGAGDPVQMMSWYDAIAFCNKLSLLEGLTPVYAVSGVDFSTLAYAEIPTTDNATWNAATANWAADGYRLPTEMELIWAMMGADSANPGVTNTTGYLKAFAGSTGSNLIGDYAVFGFGSTAEGRTLTRGTSPVGSKLPNELGLYDLSGNVSEWAWDWMDNFPSGAVTDYRGPASGTGSGRVNRGGKWNNDAAQCAVAYHNGTHPQYRNIIFGFRVVRN